MFRRFIVRPLAETDLEDAARWCATLIAWARNPLNLEFAWTAA
jgi:hypothetical protein